MSNDERRARLERNAYVALAAAALLISLAWLGSFGGPAIAITMVLVLGLPILGVLACALILSVIELVNGPPHVRFRVVLWYVLGPGLFMSSGAVNSETVGVVLTAAALVCALALPLVWLLRRRRADVQPTSVV